MAPGKTFTHGRCRAEPLEESLRVIIKRGMYVVTWEPESGICSEGITVGVHEETTVKPNVAPIFSQHQYSVHDISSCHPGWVRSELDRDS